MKRVRELTIEAATNPKMRRVHDYWLGKCAGRRMPKRADIDPLELRDLLGNLCLVDVTVDVPPRFHFRVDGSNLATITGFDLTGKYADELPDGPYRAFVLEIYNRVVAARTPLFLANEEEWEGFGVHVESATLPLSSDGETVDAILDAVFPKEI